MLALRVRRSRPASRGPRRLGVAVAQRRDFPYDRDGYPSHYDSQCEATKRPLPPIPTRLQCCCGRREHTGQGCHNQQADRGPTDVPALSACEVRLLREQQHVYDEDSDRRAKGDQTDSSHPHQVGGTPRLLDAPARNMRRLRTASETVAATSLTKERRDPACVPRAAAPRRAALGPRDELPA
jgi:hypothetical protein